MRSTCSCGIETSTKNGKQIVRTIRKNRKSYSRKNILTKISARDTVIRIFSGQYCYSRFLKSLDGSSSGTDYGLSLPWQPPLRFPTDLCSDSSVHIWLASSVSLPVFAARTWFPLTTTQPHLEFCSRVLLHTWSRAL